MGSITRALSGAALLLAAVTASAGPANEAPAGTSDVARVTSSGLDLTKLGIPTYPGMVRLVGSRPPAEHDAAAAPTPTLASFDTFVTSDRFEDVVRFYQASLRLSPVAAHPKDLATTFAGQPIPAQSHGRRSVFRLGTAPPPNERQPMAQQVLTRALGRASVVVSDFSVDPQTRQLTGQTSILVLVYR
ncbi:MAG: hypothetical protein U0610_23265 [bacterium]